MTSNQQFTTGPVLIRQSDNRIYPLRSRVTTFGKSPRSRIVLTDDASPEHAAHIVFSGGDHSFSALCESPPVLLNGKPVTSATTLDNEDIISVGNEVFLFRNGSTDSGETTLRELTPLRIFIGAIARFARSGDGGDVQCEMLAGIAQLLAADGARLVVEESPERYRTIVRYPESSGLDRFSERAIIWAKEKENTVLMHDTDWQASRESEGSLEMNKIGSVLCRSVYAGDNIRGFLYLDRQQHNLPFSEHERGILDDVGPIFGDLLALHEQARRQRDAIERLQERIESEEIPMVFDSDVMKHAVERTLKFAVTDSPVLVTGETGTGKELFARLLHKRSNRADKPFCAINCGALPENLIESELFGHEKGSFTGAHQKKTGLFEQADGGTVFLDEIGEMPLNLQVKLLRVLQESEVTPVGATASRKVAIRIVAATNRKLEKEVADGTFREDLYYRLNVLTVAIPPLRHRHRDVLLLAEYFMSKYAIRFGAERKALSLLAQARLLAYQWPGNIRQLENVIQKALLTGNGNLLLDTDLDLPDDDRKESSASSVTTDSVQTLKDARAEAEKQCIVAALERAAGNVSIAARLLDTDRKWLTKLIKVHDITLKKSS